MNLTIWIILGIGIFIGLILGNKDFRVKFFTGLNKFMGGLNKGARQINETYEPHHRPPDNFTNHIQVYARTKGDHFHIDRDCLLLQGKQFNDFNYRRITIDEAIENRLEPCRCVYETFPDHRKDWLSARRVKDLMNE